MIYDCGTFPGGGGGPFTLVFFIVFTHGGITNQCLYSIWLMVDR